MLIDGKNYTWSQSLCDACFAGFRPDVPHPVRIKEEYRDTEKCALCGTQTRSGLYVRINPREVPYPRRKEE
jgi:hypothetical protein